MLQVEDTFLAIRQFIVPTRAARLTLGQCKRTKITLIWGIIVDWRSCVLKSRIWASDVALT